MRNRLSLLLPFLALLVPVSMAARSSYSSHYGYSHSSGASSSHHSSRKTEHVSGYTTKTGKHVAPYDRHPASTAPHNTSTSHSRFTSHPADTLPDTPYKKDHIASGHNPHSSVTYDKHGKIKRSTAAKNAFKREHPCPANGHTSGSCPGYVIDHVRPLECGGADAPSNMQWQTVAEGKAKDKTERYCR
jgi:hypothetical protein